MIPANKLMSLLKDSEKPVYVSIVQGVFTVHTLLQFFKGVNCFCPPITGKRPGVDNEQVAQFHIPEEQIESIKFTRSTTGDFLVEIKVDSFSVRNKG